MFKLHAHLMQYFMPRNPPKGVYGEGAAAIGVPTTTEVDPSGKAPHEAGAKLDAGKPRLGLIFKGFARALWEVGKVGTFGADKYSDNGWMEVEDGEERYFDALCRHMLKEAIEGEVDFDSQCLHKAQRCWNDLAELELMLREKEEADTNGS